jgi:predicted protein tyrosine phosphatase
MTAAGSGASAMLHVSALRGLAEVAASLGSYDLLTLLSPDTADDAMLRALRPRRRLSLTFHDIIEASPDYIAPDRAGVEAILRFARDETRAAPLLIHCWAGISRSSAAAFIIACDANPEREQVIASELRRRAPFVTPNRLMVSLADDLLGRHGCMIDAIARIGRGIDAFEGTPYQLPLRF